MNDKELQAAVDLKVKERNKAEKVEKRKQQMEELIHFKVLNDLGQPLVDEFGLLKPSSEFKIARRNISEASVVDCISRTPVPDLKINFFVDNSGNFSVSFASFNIVIIALYHFLLLLPLTQSLSIFYQ